MKVTFVGFCQNNQDHWQHELQNYPGISSQINQVFQTAGHMSSEALCWKTLPLSRPTYTLPCPGMVYLFEVSIRLECCMGVLTACEGEVTLSRGSSKPTWYIKASSCSSVSIGRSSSADSCGRRYIHGIYMFEVYIQQRMTFTTDGIY